MPAELQAAVLVDAARRRRVGVESGEQTGGVFLSVGATRKKVLELADGIATFIYRLGSEEYAIHKAK